MNVRKTAYENRGSGLISKIEKELLEQKEKYDKLFGEYDAQFDMLSAERKNAKLKSENVLVREELKRLNKLINQLVESHKQSTINTYNVVGLQRRGKTTAGVRRDLDQKEIDNAHKQLMNSENEYAKLAERIDQLSNPTYMTELKERIIAYNEKIKKMGKTKKKMEVAQIHREKAINKVIETGEPELLQQINGIKSESSICGKKLAEVDTSVEKRAEALTSSNQKLAELTGLLKAAEDEAAKLGIDPSAAYQPSNELSSNDIKFKSFEEKKNGVIQEINLIKTRLNVALGDYSQKKSKLQKALTTLAEQTQKKNE